MTSPWAYGEKAEALVIDELVAHFEEGTVELPPDHPYLLKGAPSVYEVAGRWRVVWRDFLTMRQDAEFSTEAEAQERAALIRDGMRFVSLGMLADACTPFAEASEMWS